MPEAPLPPDAPSSAPLGKPFVPHALQGDRL